MSFTIENQRQIRMSFLYVQIICEYKIFTTSAYRKPTFSGVYIHFDSFLPSTYKLLSTHSLIDASKYVQGGLDYKLN